MKVTAGCIKHDGRRSSRGYGPRLERRRSPVQVPLCQVANLTKNGSENINVSDHIPDLQ